MMTLVPETPPPRRSVLARGAADRRASRCSSTRCGCCRRCRSQRGGLVLIAALLAAGSMALTDSVVGVLAAVFEKTQKGESQ
jgi:hypothetical protein